MKHKSQGLKALVLCVEVRLGMWSMFGGQDRGNTGLIHSRLTADYGGHRNPGSRRKK